MQASPGTRLRNFRIQGVLSPWVLHFALVSVPHSTTYGQTFGTRQRPRCRVTPTLRRAELLYTLLLQPGDETLQTFQFVPQSMLWCNLFLIKGVIRFVRSVSSRRAGVVVNEEALRTGQTSLPCYRFHSPASCHKHLRFWVPC